MQETGGVNDLYGPEKKDTTILKIKGQKVQPYPLHSPAIRNSMLFRVGLKLMYCTC